MSKNTRDEIARLDALASEYQLEYDTWYCNQIEIVKANMEANVEALRKLQERLDGPFSVWQLTYGIAVCDREVEADSCFVTTPGPDENGSWLVYGHEDKNRFVTRMISKRFFHPIAIEGPLEFIPSAGEPKQLVGCAGHRFVTAERKYLRDSDDHISAVGKGESITHSVSFNPGVVTRDEVDKMISEVLQLGPPPPPRPEDLDKKRWGKAMLPPGLADYVAQRNKER